MWEDEDVWNDVSRLATFVFGLGLSVASLYASTQFGLDWVFFGFFVFGFVLMFHAVFYITDSFKDMDAPTVKRNIGLSWLAVLFGGFLTYLIFWPSGLGYTVTSVGILAVEVIWALYIFFFVEEYHIY